MGWRKWTAKDKDLPKGTLVKIDQHFGNLSGKVGKVISTASGANFSIIKVAGQKHSFHNSDLFIKTEVFGENIKTNKSIIKESAPVFAYNVRIGNQKDGVTIKSVKVTGNSPEEFVKNLKDQLKKENMPKLSPTAEKNIISNLQKQLDQFKNLDFSENKIREVVKEEIKNLLKEGIGEDNNLPESNSYHKVIKPFDIWVLSGSEHKGEHYGNAKIYRGVYQKTKAKVGDEIHNLHGGLFYVPKSGKPIKMKTNEPTNRSAFERGSDFDKFDLTKLQEIPKENAKKVSYG